MSLESLPDRPLSREEFDTLREADQVAGAHEFMTRGNGDGELILMFLLELDGEYIALDYNHVAEHWETVTRSESFEDASQALTGSPDG